MFLLRYWQIAAGVIIAGFVFAVSWSVCSDRWQMRWDKREAEWAVTVALVKTQAAEQRLKIEVKYDDAATEYEMQLQALNRQLAARPHRLIRVCNSPAPGTLPGAGEGHPAGRPDGTAELPPGDRGPLAATLDADELIAIGARCDAQIAGLQALLR